ncbi:MAG TPA: carboxypeptidase-like regulatory domain-containing protein [Dermatophilaceae bacterium]|nr:carboxypeptidase-like regulatory domain-containing protein [Dermatophilaceae bacterium]
MRGWARAVAGLAAGFLVAGCTASASISSLPPPPSTAPHPSTSAPPDYTGVALPVAPAGRTTSTTLAMGPGAATLNGTVTGPDGAPAGGTTVRVERMVGKATAHVDVPTADDGTWSAAGILGGAYRVRAWRPPDLATLQAANIFLGAADTLAVPLQMARVYGTTPQIAVAPNPPVAGVLASVVVQVTSRTVNADGTIQGPPLVGAAVELQGGTGWGVGGLNPTLTDSTGRAKWDVVCRGAGQQPLRLVVNAVEPFQLSLPGCLPPPTTTTTLAPAPTVPGVPTTTTTTTKPGATTTTTRPGITTTTTRPTVFTTTTTTRPGGPPTTKKP